MSSGVDETAKLRQFHGNFWKQTHHGAELKVNSRLNLKNFMQRREFSIGTLAFGAATSLVGRESRGGWVKSARNPVLSQGAAGEFDCQNIFAPCVAKVDGRHFLFYCGGPAGPKTGEDLVRYQIGLALSEDGESWTKTGRPLLPLEVSLRAQSHRDRGRMAHVLRRAH